jgi:hypothetical protein
MADLSVKPIGADIKPMPGMSLGEMINFARGAQEYQKGGISLSLEKQKEQERNAMTQFLSKPENYQTDGRVDINKLNAAVPALAPLTGAEYISSLTGLSTAQSESQKSGISLTLEQEKEKERKGQQTFLADEKNYMTDGQIDLAKANNFLKLFPLTGQDTYKKMAEISTSRTQASKAAQDLTQDQRNIISQRLGMLGRLKVDNKDAYIAELNLLEQENPNNPSLKTLIESYKFTLGQLPENADLPSLAISAANSLMSVGAQQERFAPQVGTANTGAATFVTTTQPSMAGEAPTVSVADKPLVTAQLPPGSREVPTGEYDLNNNPIVNVLSPDGRFLGRRAVTTTPSAADLPGGSQLRPVSRTSITPEITPVAQLPPGETVETRKAADQIRLSASEAAKQVPMQTFNNNQIIKLADDVITGRGASFVGALSGGYAGLPFTSDNATNLNQLGHYMALQTASLASSSGLGGTDAARGIAGEISGTIDWTAPAIKQTARVNRALSTATELFNQGVQKSFEKNKDPFSAREFQNKWSQTVDINAVRLYDAMKNSDNEAIREVVNQVGGKDSAGYKRLVDNIKQIKKLLGGQ